MEWRNKGLGKGFITRLCIKLQILLVIKEILVQYFKCLFKYKIKDFIIIISQSNKNLMKSLPHLQLCKWLRVHILSVPVKWREPLSNRCIDQIKVWVVAAVASVLSPLTWKPLTNQWEILSKLFLVSNLHNSSFLKNSTRLLTLCLFPNKMTMKWLLIHRLHKLIHISSLT